MNIYIAGPITGLDEWSKDVIFSSAQVAVQAKGHTPINPYHFEKHLPQNEDHEKYMRVCIEIIRSFADAIYFVPGWKKSAGCQEEYSFAVNNMMRIYTNADDIPFAEEQQFGGAK